MLRSAQFDKATGMASRRPFKNTNFMLSPPGMDMTDYSVNGIDTAPPNQSRAQTPAGASQSAESAKNSPRAKSPKNRRGRTPRTGEFEDPDVINPLNTQISVCSVDEDGGNSAEANPPLQRTKKMSGADSPVWKQRGGMAMDAWSQPHIQGDQRMYQQHQYNPHAMVGRSASGRRPMSFVRQLSEGGHSTRFVRTESGCVHITISWREIAERIDGILFWAFLVSSVVVFTLIFYTVDYEDPSAQDAGNASS